MKTTKNKTRLLQVIQKTSKAWERLYKIEAQLVETWEQCTQAERDEILESLGLSQANDPYELFANLGA